MAFFPEKIWHGKLAMGTNNNPLSTEEVTLSLNSQTVWYLDRLIEKGLYGNKRAEAAKIVIYDHCKILIGQGKLTEAPAVLPVNAVAVETRETKK